MFIVKLFFIIDVYCQTIPISFSAILSVSPTGPLAPTLSHFSRLCLTHLSLRSMQLTAPTEVLRGGLWFLDVKRHKKPSLSSAKTSFLYFSLSLSLYVTFSKRERENNKFRLVCIWIISLDMSQSKARGRSDAHVSCIMLAWQWGS